MELKYHIKYLYGELYAVSTKLELNGAHKEVVTRTQCKSTELPEIVKKARLSISNAFFYARRRDESFPNNNRYVWDCDISDLQPRFRTGSTPSLKSTQTQKIDNQKRVLEVKKINGVWTIVKHDSELLTWSEACELLKQRI